MSLTNTKKAVLFGGSGFVGRYLAKSLTNDGWSVNVVARRPHRHRDLLVMPTLKLRQIEEYTAESIASFIGEGDTVVNLIGILNESKRNSFERIHTQLPKLISDACIEKQARRFVHISSLGADTEAPSAYLRSKGKAEKAIFEAIEQGLDAVVFRPSIIFGRHDLFTNQFASLLKMSFGFFVVVSPESKLQPVYVRDVVHCIQHAMNARETSCNSCDLAGPDIYTMKELIQLIDKMIGRRHRMIPLSAALSRLLATFLQFAPGKPLTPDNLLSLQVENVIKKEFPAPYGMQPRRFEDVAKNWLSPQSEQFDIYRTKAGR